jgi:hypothetical protein
MRLARIDGPAASFRRHIWTNAPDSMELLALGGDSVDACFREAASSGQSALP